MIKNNLNALNISLICLLLISLFLNYHLYSENQEKNRYYTVYYIEDFFNEIKESISLLDSMIARGETDYREISFLVERLNYLDYMLRSVPYYFDGMGGGTNYIGYAAVVMNRGVSYEGLQIPPFFEEQEIDQSELAFLKLFKDRLTSVYVQLESEDTNNLSSNLTKNKFEKIIMKDVFIIGAERELLEEYLKYTNPE
ncbi:hypothetical protein [Oceanobacillus manasiensis]|uniref:hypothetical protein n=1 Tax=Oceanobacillus manasiensis TaxID=586413 RepID=UPI0005A76F4F|nr:hypothetical protein [Oceanobacillus manasiensis]